MRVAPLYSHGASPMYVYRPHALLLRAVHRSTGQCNFLFSNLVRALVRYTRYRGRRRRTHSLEDQLDRADAGSWQIADGSDTGS